MLSRLLLTQHKRFVPQGTHPNRASFGLENRIYINDSRATSDNTAYMLRANALALRDVVYAGNVIRNRLWDGFKQ